MGTFASILAAIQTLGAFLKAAQGVLAWMKDRDNKQFVLDLHSVFQDLDKVKQLPTPEEQSGAKREVAKRISDLISRL